YKGLKTKQNDDFRVTGGDVAAGQSEDDTWQCRWRLMIRYEVEGVRGGWPIRACHVDVMTERYMIAGRIPRLLERGNNW
ncbi:hypothetical protein Tco_1267774, partial [Tanacetum coccineum]